MKTLLQARYRSSMIALIALLVFAAVGRCDDEMWAKFSKLILQKGGNASGEGVIMNLGGVGDIATGDKFVIAAGFTLADVPTAIVGRYRLTIPGKPDVSLTAYELCGWDPVKKTIDNVAYWSDNSVERVTLDRRDGDTFLGTYSFALPTGKSVTEEIEFVFNDNGSADFNFTTGPNKGKTLSTWKWSDEVSAQQVVQSYGDFMVGGVWKHTGEEHELVDGEWVSTGKVTNEEHRYRWLEDKKVLELTATVDGKEPAAVTMIGVNPVTKRCTWWGFGKDGPGWFNFDFENDGVWRLGGGPFMTPEGDVISWTAKAVKKGKDELHTEGATWIKNGERETMADEAGIWKRYPE
jgi:hypothetical protein